MKNLIGITMGDPRGIGPEIVAKAWKELSDEERERLLVYGDRTAISTAAEIAGTEFDQKHLVITSSTHPPIQKVGDEEAARLAISAIDAALVDISSAKIAGIVTAPVNKRRVQLARPQFLGHTEYLSKAARVRDTVMMFASAEPLPGQWCQLGTKQVCISLVTMHLPLKDVAATVTTERIVVVIRQTHDALKNYFGCPHARIAVMALNPHAGEGGSLGNEEEAVIIPAIERALKEGITCVGPIPADVLFRKPEDFDYDAVVAMYHDQGLIPAKIFCQARCVNVTLGLPYVRTSPGHGTAEDIAWMGTADATSMLAAIRLAQRLVG